MGSGIGGIAGGLVGISPMILEELGLTFQAGSSTSNIIIQGTSAYKEAVEEALKRIWEVSIKTRNLIRSIERSDYPVVIKYRPGTGGAYPINWESHILKQAQGGTIFFDPYWRFGAKDEFGGKTYREPVISLAHELGHIKDYIKGKFQPKLELGPKYGNPLRELTPMKYENIIRKYYKEISGTGLRIKYFQEVE